MSDRLLRSRRGLLVGLTLVGALLRVPGLGERPLWLDEAMLYWAAVPAPWTAVTEGTQGTSAGPLFVGALSLARRALGDDEGALRALACAAGVLAVPAAYLAGRALAGVRVGLLVAGLVALGPEHVRYSREVREYSLALLLGFLLLAGVAAVLRRPRPARALAVGALAGLALGVQYGLALLWGGVTGALLLAWPRLDPPRRRAALLLQVPVLVALVPLWTGVLSAQLAGGAVGAAGRSAYLAHGYWDGSLADLPRLLVDGWVGAARFAFPAGPLVLLLALAGAAACREEDRPADVLLSRLLPSLVLLASGAALAGAHPLLGGRQCTYLAPPLLLLAARGLVQVSRAGPSLRRGLALPALLLLAALGLTGSLEVLRSRGPENLKPLLGMLAALRQPGDAVWVYYGAVPAFRYYTRGASPGELFGETRLVLGRESRSADQAYLVEIAPLLEGGGRVWLVFSHVYGEERQRILRGLARSHAVREVARAEGVRLDVVE